MERPSSSGRHRNRKRAGSKGGGFKHFHGSRKSPRKTRRNKQQDDSSTLKVKSSSSEPKVKVTSCGGGKVMKITVTIVKSPTVAGSKFVRKSPGRDSGKTRPKVSSHDSGKVKPTKKNKSKSAIEPQANSSSTIGVSSTSGAKSKSSNSNLPSSDMKVISKKSKVKSASEETKPKAEKISSSDSKIDEIRKKKSRKSSSEKLKTPSSDPMISEIRKKKSSKSDSGKLKTPSSNPTKAIWNSSASISVKSSGAFPMSPKSKSKSSNEKLSMVSSSAKMCNNKSRVDSKPKKTKPTNTMSNSDDLSMGKSNKSRDPVIHWFGESESHCGGGGIKIPKTGFTLGSGMNSVSRKTIQIVNSTDSTSTSKDNNNNNNNNNGNKNRSLSGKTSTDGETTKCINDEVVKSPEFQVVSLIKAQVAKSPSDPGKSPSGKIEPTQSFSAKMIKSKPLKSPKVDSDTGQNDDNDDDIVILNEPIKPMPSDLGLQAVDVQKTTTNKDNSNKTPG